MTADEVTQLAGYRELELWLGTGLRRITLAVGGAADVITRVRDAPTHDLDDLVFTVLETIEVIDDEPPGYDEAVAIVRDTAALARLLTARNRWLEGLRTFARFRALCPHCREREAVLELVTVALALSSPLPPLTMPGGAFLAVPAIAAARPRGRRPGVAPAAARLAIELPSGRLAPEFALSPRRSTAVLRDADAPAGLNRQEAAWELFAPPGDVPEAGHAYRHGASTGFTAIVRMAAAIGSLDDRDDVGPEDVEALSVADFLALDAAYFLAANCDQPRPDACVVVCEVCAGGYLPLLG